MASCRALQCGFYELESQPAGELTQLAILLVPLASWSPMLVFLIATQNTKATSTTIKVYSTKPWPSSSTSKRLSRFMGDYNSFFDSANFDRWSDLNFAYHTQSPKAGYLPFHREPRKLAAAMYFGASLGERANIYKKLFCECRPLVGVGKRRDERL